MGMPYTNYKMPKVGKHKGRHEVQSYAHINTMEDAKRHIDHLLTEKNLMEGIDYYIDRDIISSLVSEAKRYAHKMSRFEHGGTVGSRGTDIYGYGQTAEAARKDFENKVREFGDKNSNKFNHKAGSRDDTIHSEKTIQQHS